MAGWDEVKGADGLGGPRALLWAGMRRSCRTRVLWGRPRVGLRAAVQPWAQGRNPVGIGVVLWAMWGSGGVGVRMVVDL